MLQANPDKVAEVWLRLFLLVSSHQKELAGALLQSARVIASEEGSQGDLLSMAERVLRQISSPTPADLLHLRALLIRFEHAFARRSLSDRINFRHASAQDRRYLLVDRLNTPIRDGMPDRFTTGWEYGLPLVLELKHQWIALVDLQVHWQFRRLHAEGNRVRVALASFAAPEEMHWKAHHKNLAGKIPVRCLGPRDPDTLWRRLETILKEAEEHRADILLLPELTVDETLLGKLKEWLSFGMTRAPCPSLQWVVAGSRHADATADFVNRCTVLGQDGDGLWEQDKLQPYRIPLKNMRDLNLMAEGEQVEGMEPTRLGNTLLLQQTEPLGIVSTPICIDFLEWFNADASVEHIPADFYLVPAMTGSTTPFQDRGRQVGSRFASACLVANACSTLQYVAAFPTKTSPSPTTTAHLAIWDIPCPVKNNTMGEETN